MQYEFEVATEVEIANQFSEAPLTPLMLRDKIKLMPKTLIVNTADIVHDFRLAVTDMAAMDHDEVEIFSAVLGVIAEDTSDVSQRLERLSERYSEIIELRIDELNVTDDGKVLKRAVLAFGQELYNRLKENKLYVSGQLSYFYKEEVGGDLVLTKLPY